MNNHDLATELETLLDLEKAELLAGHTRQLDALFAQKENLVERLSLLSLPQGTLVHLRKKSTQNHLLLRAVSRALQGTKALLERSDPGPETRPYTATGARETLQGQRPSLAHKA